MCVLCGIQSSYLQVFVDMTFGAGGHTRRILQAAPKCKVYCLDRDPFAIEIAREMSEHKYVFISHSFFFVKIVSWIRERIVSLADADLFSVTKIII